MDDLQRNGLPESPGEALSVPFLLGTQFCIPLHTHSSLKSTSLCPCILLLGPRPALEAASRPSNFSQGGQDWEDAF